MAQDQSTKRLNLTTRAVEICRMFQDWRETAARWHEEANPNYCGPFVQEEFDNTAVKHVSVESLNALWATVIPSIMDNYKDEGNQGTNEIIINKMLG